MGQRYPGTDCNPYICNNVLHSKGGFCESCQPGGLLPMKLVVLTTVTMLAFSGNSVLCRLALGQATIDAASFTAIRLASGALMLYLLLLTRPSFRRSLKSDVATAGSWPAAAWLCIYAASFSLAYVDISAATGALILFGAVQLSMMIMALLSGERPTRMAWVGYALAVSGLLLLLWPGADAPSLRGGLLMFASGTAWGMYSHYGKDSADPLVHTAGNFLRTLPGAALMLLLSMHAWHISEQGLMLAIASGAMASGLGYALWYHIIPQIRSSVAATVQLSVPLLAALGGVVFIQETLSLQLILTAIMILGGIALVVQYDGS